MDPYLGEIRVFGFNYAPENWAFCAGQTLPISQFSALYSLLGTQFGGDGRTNFGVPDFRGKVSVGRVRVRDSAATRWEPDRGDGGDADLEPARRAQPRAERERGEGVTAYRERQCAGVPRKANAVRSRTSA